MPGSKPCGSRREDLQTKTLAWINSPDFLDCSPGHFFAMLVPASVEWLDPAARVAVSRGPESQWPLHQHPAEAVVPPLLLETSQLHDPQFDESYG